jgi:hypothetical protein
MMEDEPLAFIYEQECHCPPCTEARFGRGVHHLIVELDARRKRPRDREGNPVEVVIIWEEWYDPGTYDLQVLACADCAVELDRIQIRRFGDLVQGPGVDAYRYVP